VSKLLRDLNRLACVLMFFVALGLWKLGEIILWIWRAIL
jgi:hypothetical protein